MRHWALKVSLTAGVFVLAGAGVAFTSVPRPLSCVIHVHSSYSSAQNKPLDTIAREARSLGIDAVIFSDHDSRRWEYGIYPLRGVVKKSHSERGILDSGAYRYLADLRSLQLQYPEVVLIPGVESMPFYYWTGSPFDKTLTLHDGNKHLIVAGLTSPADYDRLPLVSNPRAGDFDAFLLWPLLLVIAGLLIHWRPLAVLMVAAGAVLLYNNYPFRHFQFDQYSGDQGEHPYQALIDYAGERGALTFWAHPEAPNWDTPQNIGPVSVVTKKYTDSLLATSGYTGFAVYSEGYRTAGKPGGTWDQVLKEYCRGIRKEPAWAIGELDYGTESSFALDAIQNIVWAGGKDERSVLEGLRRGAFYVLWRINPAGPSLDEFTFSSGGKKSICGRELPFRGSVRLAFGLGSNGAKYPVKITVIRDGTAVKVLEGTAHSRMVYEDTRPLAPGRHYYRAVIETPGRRMILLNPVFVMNRRAR